MNNHLIPPNNHLFAEVVTTFFPYFTRAFSYWLPPNHLFIEKYIVKREGGVDTKSNCTKKIRWLGGYYSFFYMNIGLDDLPPVLEVVEYGL